MKPETEIVRVGDWQVYVERYIYPGVTDSVICVNGSFSTTLAFRSCVRNFKNRVNVILFDLPFLGQSREHNDLTKPLSKTDEVFILQSLINHYEPSYLLSISWGGLAALKALSSRPRSIRKAVVASFSTKVNDAMNYYVSQGKKLLDEGKGDEAAMLLNTEVGKYLPNLLKQVNYEHLRQFDESAQKQVRYHVAQITEFNQADYIDTFRQIDTPILFINGEQDEYTTAQDIKELSNYINNCEFITVPQAGHFIYMESRFAADYFNDVMNGFLFVEEAMAS